MKTNQILNDLKKGQKIFGEDIAIIINSVLLTFVYFFGVGFTFLLAKLFIEPIYLCFGIIKAWFN